MWESIPVGIESGPANKVMTAFQNRLVDSRRLVASTPGPAELHRYSTEGISLKRAFLIVGVIVGTIVLVGYVCLAIVHAPFEKRDADGKIAFEPLLELRPVILDNSFGVYVVEFGSASALSDLTAHKLMALNKLPSEYDLTLILRTGAVTDQSISTLSRLNTTDTIVLDGTGLTDAGIAALEHTLPGGTLLRRTGLDTDHHNRAGGEPSRAPEPGQRDLTDGQSVLEDR